MKRKGRVSTLWRNAVSLGQSWWVFADLRKKKRFRELQRESQHLGFKRNLELEVVGRINDGELKAFGIEYGSDIGPVAIPDDYFSRTAEINFDQETVTALGKRFGQVRIEGKRVPVRVRAVVETVDPSSLKGRDTPIPGPMRDPEPATETERVGEAPNPAAETNQAERPVRGKGDLSPPKARGRPSKMSEIEQAIDLLLKQRVDLAAMPRPQAYNAVRKCAEEKLKSNTKIGFTDPVIQRALLRRFGVRR